jgi:ABC-type Fe3+ transport system permease subunit/DNA-binding beta-propeller fold protein YncE
MRTSAAPWLLAALGGIAWLAVVFLPLLLLYVLAAATPVAENPAGSAWTLASLTARTAALAAVVAALAVLLGCVPGRLLGTAERHASLLFCLALAPVLLPRYVLYYVWSLPLAPTTALGQYLAVQPLAVTRWIGTLTTMFALILWYWPLAALLLAQGWRNLDREVLESAALEAGPWRRLTRVVLPMLRGPLVLAFAVCFAMVLVEYDTFHLAGVSTIGSALGVIFEQTGSAEAVARASLPLVAVAAVVGVALSRRLRSVAVQVPLAAPAPGRNKRAWIVFAVLVGVSLAAPIALLIASVSDFSALEQFWRLQRDGLANSVLAAVLASALALAMAGGVMAAERLGTAGRWLAGVMQVTVLVAMFVPGALVGVAILRMQSALGLPAAVGDGWWILSAGQAARFAGVALVVLRLSHDGADEHFREMAGADGAGPLRAWLEVHLPRTWPLVAGAAVLVAMFSLTEVPATLVLLPPGVPDFTQRLLNQMHYARDQHVIASCLALVAVYLALAVLVVLLAKVKTWRSGAAPLLVLAAALLCAGCDAGPQGEAVPHVIRLIGSSGRGPGEFLYPRAIGFDGDGNLYAADRTGRVQHLSPEGRPLGTLQLPMTEKGYPTGLAVGPDGKLYVADTHYHRVLVYEHVGRGAAPAPESPRAMSEAGAAPRPTWRLAREFGSFGTGDGQFIYPTHVAFAADDNVGRGAAPAPESPRAMSEAGAAPRPTFRIYVSEYGGNDRVSIFTPEGTFVKSFGRSGSGEGEFSRPEALAVDPRRRVLYVADACNHRIARYTLEGELIGYFGSVGQGPGELRYPYGLALLADGTLVACEYGNNRLQFFGADGRSLKCLGRAGRAPGELAYPWGVAAGPDGNVYVVDAGNNRVQVWRP